MLGRARGGAPSRPLTSSDNPRASVHVIGCIAGASGFKERSLLCRWKLVAGHDWSVAQGTIKGTTHVGCPMDDGDGLSVWEHPLDVNFEMQGLQGWPKLTLSVFHRAPFIGNEVFCAYGMCSLPVTPGEHTMTCPTWRANDRSTRRCDELTAFFTGVVPQLVDKAFVHDRDEAFSANIQTIGMGLVHLRLSLLFRNFHLLQGGQIAAMSLRRAQQGLMQRRASIEMKRTDSTGYDSQHLSRNPRPDNLASTEAKGDAVRGGQDDSWRVPSGGTRPMGASKDAARRMADGGHEDHKGGNDVPDEERKRREQISERMIHAATARRAHFDLRQNSSEDEAVVAVREPASLGKDSVPFGGSPTLPRDPNRVGGSSKPGISKEERERKWREMEARLNEGKRKDRTLMGGRGKSVREGPTTLGKDSLPFGGSPTLPRDPKTGGGSSRLGISKEAREKNWSKMESHSMDGEEKDRTSLGKEEEGRKEGATCKDFEPFGGRLTLPRVSERAGGASKPGMSKEEREKKRVEMKARLIGGKGEDQPLLGKEEEGGGRGRREGEGMWREEHKSGREEGENDFVTSEGVSRYAEGENSQDEEVWNATSTLPRRGDYEIGVESGSDGGRAASGASASDGVGRGQEEERRYVGHTGKGKSGEVREEGGGSEGAEGMLDGRRRERRRFHNRKVRQVVGEEIEEL